jgi:hypothetical protein
MNVCPSNLKFRKAINFINMCRPCFLFSTVRHLPDLMRQSLQTAGVRQHVMQCVSHVTLVLFSIEGYL